MVSERHLAEPRTRSTAHDGRRGSTVVRRPKRRRCNETASGQPGPGDGVDARHLERSLGIERGQDPGESSREHRLSDSRRPREQEVVTAGGGDLECPTCTLLPANVGEIRRGSSRVGVEWRRACGRFSVTSEVLGRLGQVPDRHGIDACEDDLRSGLGGANDAREPGRSGSLGRRKRSGNGPKPTVKRQFTDRRVTRKTAGRKLLGGSENREGDRQVESRSLLSQIRRCEIDRDAPSRRPLEFRRGDPASHSLLRLLARSVGEPDDAEGGHA